MMRITRGIPGMFGSLMHLHLDITANSGTDALAKILGCAERFAAEEGLEIERPAWLQKQFAKEEDKLRAELDDARAGRAKAQERRDRWRKRAEDAESALCAQVEATEASFRRTAEARAEVDRLRRELLAVVEGIRADLLRSREARR